MTDLPLSAMLGALFVLVILSGIFSGSETAMMAANRYRLRYAAQNGHRGAKLALALLAQTDKLLGLILLGNTLFNAAAATLVSVITIELFGGDIGVTTALVDLAGTMREQALVAADGGAV